MSTSPKKRILLFQSLQSVTSKNLNVTLWHASPSTCVVTVNRIVALEKTN